MRWRRTNEYIRPSGGDQSVAFPDVRNPYVAACCAEVITTVKPATSELGQFLAGFLAAEGCFSGNGDTRFCLEVGLGSIDRAMCTMLQDFLGVGHVYDSPRRKDHYDDETVYVVQSLRELIDGVVPFMDVHLPPSYKREQYLAWKERLLDYWEHRAKRVRPCIVEGCDKPRRAHGLCRHHLFKKYRM